MFIEVKKRKDTMSMMREHKFLIENRRKLCVKNLDETMHLQSEKKKWIQEVKGETTRMQKT